MPGLEAGSRPLSSHLQHPSLRLLVARLVLPAVWMPGLEADTTLPLFSLSLAIYSKDRGSQREGSELVQHSTKYGELTLVDRALPAVFNRMPLTLTYPSKVGVYLPCPRSLLPAF
jgi:hypothetical protein